METFPTALDTDSHPPLRRFVPHHSFLREDGMPLVPGAVAELRFGLMPVSTLVGKGHRVRVAIAGHDKGTFARIPAEGRPIITVHRHRIHRVSHRHATLAGIWRAHQAAHGRDDTPAPSASSVR